MPRRANSNWIQPVLVTALALTVGFFGGCSGSSKTDPAVQTLTLTDFAKRQQPSVGSEADAEPKTNVEVVAAAGMAPVALEEVEIVEEEFQSETAVASTTQPAFPLGASGSAKPRRILKPGDAVVVDSVIGQVAGRPILADAFMANFSDRLRRAAVDYDQREFVQQAAQIIGEQVSQEVVNNLFLAESQASLTEQQQMGLLAFMQRLREDVVGRGRGSVFQTQSELAEQGLTLDEYLAMERDTTLIRQLIFDKVWPRVIVSWKDVEREYQRRYAEFNPPASVTVLRIRVAASDAATIEEVKSRFAQGQSFAEVSEWIGSPAAGNLDPEGRPFAMGPGGISDIQVNPDYKPELAKLTVGQTSSPIEIGRNIVWLHVESIDQPQQLTLYDVQRRLIAELRDRRFREEYRHYIDSLLKRGIYDNIPEMTQRVLAVALMRYNP